MNQRGWVFVLLGLLISSFLGGAVRVYFSPVRVRELVTQISKRKQPKFDFEFSGAKLRLSKSGWPTIAVEMKDIVIRAKDPCITNSTIAIDQILIPFELSALLRSKVKFGHIQANNVQFHYRPSSCEVAVVEPSQVDEVTQFERFFQKRWSQEVVNTSKILRSVSLKSLTLLRDDQSLPPAIFEALELQFNSKRGEGEVQFNVRWGAPWIGQSPFGVTRVQAIVRASEVQVQASGNLKEGQMKSTLLWAIDRGEIALNLNSKDMPLGHVVGFAHHWGQLQKFKPNFKDQWLDCDLSMGGPIRNFMNVPVQLHQCRLYGDLGEMQIKTGSIKSLSEGGVLIIRIQNLDVREILTSFGAGQTWGVVSNFGLFSGEFVIPNQKDFELKGEVVGSELYLSNQESRLRQGVERFNLQLAQTGGRFSGLASGLEIKGGSIIGEVTFNFQDLSEGIFQFALSDIQLPEDVQKMYLNGDLRHLAVYGQGRFQNLKLLDFRGSIGVKKFSSQAIDLETIKLDVDFAAEIWHLAGSIGRASFSAASGWGQSLAKHLSEYFDFKNGLLQARLTGEIELDNQSGVWSGVRAVPSSESSRYIESLGSWNSSEGVQGKLLVMGRANPKSKKASRIAEFEMDGTWSAPTFRGVEKNSTNP